MVHDRWYPTVLTLGDGRVGNSREVLVVCGHGAGDMEIYDEDRQLPRGHGRGHEAVPDLYPGLHLLPNNSVFYSRTGWKRGPGGGPFPGDDQSSYFALTGASTGAWTDIAPILPGLPDRTKACRSCCSPRRRRRPGAGLGGSDSSNNNSYEVIDASSLSPATNWGRRRRFRTASGASRALSCSPTEPSSSAEASSDELAVRAVRSEREHVVRMAALPTVRDYHSVALPPECAGGDGRVGEDLDRDL